MLIDNDIVVRAQIEAIIGELADQRARTRIIAYHSAGWLSDSMAEKLLRLFEGGAE